MGGPWSGIKNYLAAVFPPTAKEASQFARKKMNSVRPLTLT